MVGKEITEAMIAEWKVKYGEVYKIVLSGDEYYYRPLRRTEYKTITQNADAAVSFREEQIVQKCVIHPSIEVGEYGATKAGIVSTLTDCVMMVSGFGLETEPIKL